MDLYEAKVCEFKDIKKVFAWAIYNTESTWQEFDPKLLHKESA